MGDKKNFIKNLIVGVTIINIGFNSVKGTAECRLNYEQKYMANYIAEVVIDNYDTYGVLPSVAVAQAFIESSLGVNQVRPNNLWGIKPDDKYATYDNINDGIFAYLNVINNGLYDKAIGCTDYTDTIKYILDGGYYGEDDGGTIEEYYNNIINSIHKYNWHRFDIKLEKLKQEKHKKGRAKQRNKSVNIKKGTENPLELMRYGWHETNVLEIVFNILGIK